MGECADARLVVDRDGIERQVQALRIPVQKLNAARLYSHDRPGETFQLLSAKVGYLKLSSIRAADVPQILGAAAATHGLIVDIRNYPGDFVPFVLGSRLIQKATPFVRFTAPDVGNPGAFRWKAPTIIEPNRPSYSGNVIVLVDEMSISQSEYTAMALRAAPRVRVFGSMTAGADGNVSAIVLPGNFRAGISGIGVFYPNRKPTQRVGIVPDKLIAPTIAGIRAGRDEALEAALQELSSQSESAP
jgi:C-terminal processing protease CtpA/Prc